MIYKTIIYNWDFAPELEVLNRDDRDSFRYFFGQKTEKKVQLKFRSQSKDDLCDIFSFKEYVIVSKKVKQILMKYRDVEYEFIPVQILQKGKVSIYHIFNVLTQCDCVDFEKSDINVDFGEITLVKKLVIDSSTIRDLPYFLIEKSAVQLICFNEDVVDDLSQSGCTGLKFIPIENYSHLSRLQINGGQTDIAKNKK